MTYAYYLVCLFGVMLVMAVVTIMRGDHQISKLREDRKKMVELLGRVILDVDQQNGRVMNDTRQKLNEWVNE